MQVDIFGFDLTYDFWEHKRYLPRIYGWQSHRVDSLTQEYLRFPRKRVERSQGQGLSPHNSNNTEVKLRRKDQKRRRLGVGKVKVAKGRKDLTAEQRMSNSMRRVNSQGIETPLLTALNLFIMSLPTRMLSKAVLIDKEQLYTTQISPMSSAWLSSAYTQKGRSAILLIKSWLLHN